MLSAMIDGSLANSPMILSAGGQGEHPCAGKKYPPAGGAGVGGMGGTDDGDDGADAKRTRPKRKTIIGHHRCHTETRETPAPTPSPLNGNFREYSRSPGTS